MRWRQRIGEGGCEWLLAQTIEAARTSGLIKPRSLHTIVLDTTVQPKAIARPTDSRLLDRAREQLVDEAKKAGIALRQSNSRVGKHANRKAGRYAHAKQFKRMGREIRKLRTWLGRVIRDVQRKDGEVSGRLKQRLEIAQRMHAQKRDSKNKLYARHAPEVEQVGIVTGHTPKIVLADRGYREGNAPAGTRLLISHTRRLPAALKWLLNRRQVNEPMIGHMESDGLLERNRLRGADGDALHALHALLCGAGQNLRMMLRYLRVLCLALLAWIHRLGQPSLDTGATTSACLLTWNRVVQDRLFKTKIEAALNTQRLLGENLLELLEGLGLQTT